MSFKNLPFQINWFGLFHAYNALSFKMTGWTEVHTTTLYVHTCLSEYMYAQMYHQMNGTDI